MFFLGRSVYVHVLTIERIHVSSSAVSNLLPLNMRKIRSSILIARLVPKCHNFCQYIKEHKRFEFAILNFSQTDARALKRGSSTCIKCAVKIRGLLVCPGVTLKRLIEKLPLGRTLNTRFSVIFSRREMHATRRPSY